MPRRRRLGGAPSSPHACAVALPVSSASAAPGDLDGGFAAGGVHTASFMTSGLQEDSHKVAVDSQGRVVVAATLEGQLNGGLPRAIKVFRLTAQGQPDPTFAGRRRADAAGRRRHLPRRTGHRRAGPADHRRDQRRHHDVADRARPAHDRGCARHVLQRRRTGPGLTARPDRGPAGLGTRDRRRRRAARLGRSPSPAACRTRERSSRRGSRRAVTWTPVTAPEAGGRSGRRAAGARELSGVGPLPGGGAFVAGFDGRPGSSRASPRAARSTRRFDGDGHGDERPRQGGARHREQLRARGGRRRAADRRRAIHQRRIRAVGARALDDRRGGGHELWQRVPRSRRRARADGERVPPERRGRAVRRTARRHRRPARASTRPTT